MNLYRTVLKTLEAMFVSSLTLVVRKTRLSVLVFLLLLSASGGAVAQDTVLVSVKHILDVNGRRSRITA